MIYRDFLDLTDEEIQFIVNEIFSPERIWDISRDKEFREINCYITMSWETGDKDDPYEDIADELTLTDKGLQVDFSITRADELKWRKYLMAKGCHFLLKDNPYIEQSN